MVGRVQPRVMGLSRLERLHLLLLMMTAQPHSQRLRRDQQLLARLPFQASWLAFAGQAGGGAAAGIVEGSSGSTPPRVQAVECGRVWQRCGGSITADGSQQLCQQPQRQQQEDP